MSKRAVAAKRKSAHRRGGAGDRAARGRSRATDQRRAVDEHASRVVTSGTLESQARAAGSAVVSGETNVAARLSPAPAASLQVTTSLGRPIPRPLRSSLEEAFGADLAAVRLHADAPAHAAARALGANAFASGAHIYFASGAFRPECAEGLHLLAHEIAHALQQTGRAAYESSTNVASGQRLRVTDVTSSGPVQLDPGDPPAASTGVTRSISLEDLLKAHHPSRSVVPGVKATGTTTMVRQLETLAFRIQLATGDVLTTGGPGITEVRDETLLPGVQKSPHLLAFAVDCLKVLGDRDHAAGIILEHRDLETVFPDFSLLSRLTPPVPLETWLDEQLALPGLVEFYPDAFAETFATFLFSPFRTQVELNTRELRRFIKDGRKTKAFSYREFRDELLANAVDLTARSPSEFFLQAAAWLAEADDRRMSLLVEVLERAKSNPFYKDTPEPIRPIFVRYLMADSLPGAMSVLIADPEPGIAHIWKGVEKKILKTALRAFDLWKAGDELIRAGIARSVDQSTEQSSEAEAPSEQQDAPEPEAKADETAEDQEAAEEERRSPFAKYGEPS